MVTMSFHVFICVFRAATVHGVRSGRRMGNITQKTPIELLQCMESVPFIFESMCETETLQILHEYTIHRIQLLLLLLLFLNCKINIPVYFEVKLGQKFLTVTRLKLVV